VCSPSYLRISDGPELIWTARSAGSHTTGDLTNPKIGCHYFPPYILFHVARLRGMMTSLMSGKEMVGGCHYFPPGLRLFFVVALSTLGGYNSQLTLTLPRTINTGACVYPDSVTQSRSGTMPPINVISNVVTVTMFIILLTSKAALLPPNARFSFLLPCVTWRLRLLMSDIWLVEFELDSTNGVPRCCQHQQNHVLDNTDIYTYISFLLSVIFKFYSMWIIKYDNSSACTNIAWLFRRLLIPSFYGQ